MPIKPIIELINLSHIYNANTALEKKAVDNISFNIFPGESIGIIGHTGSGKSTLVQHLNALLAPTSGKVLIDGEDINHDKKQLKRIRQKVGLVFQYPENQLFDETVYKDIAFGPKNIGLTEEEIHKRVHMAISQVRLSEELLSKSPFELSGGQKRRAAIAGVLAMNPHILILDEPTAGLDPGGRDEILSQLAQLHKDNKQTLLIVSHSMEDIAKLTDRIIVMAEGQVLCDGPTKEIFLKHEELEMAALTVPQIAKIMGYFRNAGIPVPKDILNVSDAAKYLHGLFAASNRAGL